MHYFNMVTLGPVREFVEKTEPGEDYNITITTVNRVGRTVGETLFVELPAKGILKIVIIIMVEDALRVAS